MAEQNWRLIVHTPYRWSNAEPWPWRRDWWMKRHPYPTPLWERRRLPWLMRRERRGFARHSPVMRRYRAWSEQRRRDLFAQVRSVHPVF